MIQEGFAELESSPHDPVVGQRHSGHFILLGQSENIHFARLLFGFQLGPMDVTGSVQKTVVRM